jgi:hypothetical protein
MVRGGYKYIFNPPKYAFLQLPCHRVPPRDLPVRFFLFGSPASLLADRRRVCVTPAWIPAITMVTAWKSPDGWIHPQKHGG